MSDVENKPKTDCFAYNDKTSVPNCKALNDLYCRNEKCRFYKPGKWSDIFNGRNGC